MAAFVLGSMFLAGCGARQPKKPSGPGVFDTAVAMRTLFGNFKSGWEGSLYRVPAEARNDSNFATKNEIRARPLLVQSATEDGVQKYYVLTWAKPAGQPFDCRGCAPLISAAVFTPGRSSWELESVSRGAAVFGDFGQPPEAELVKVGQEHHAFLLRFTSSRSNTETQDLLLVPWKGTMNDALRVIVGKSNKGDCGGAYPCYGYQRSLKFMPGTHSDYYDVAFTLSGTNLSSTTPLRVHRVGGNQLFRFENGKYVEVSNNVIAARRE